MKIKYQDKIVAFIDVLGFSNIVYSDSVISLNNYFNFVLNNFKTATLKNNFNYYLISDSIVISANRSKLNLQKLVKMLAILQTHLLLDGILMRGAISYGDLYQNKSNNILVGPGLINAYKLESKAIYPRIILDRRFIKDYYESTALAITDLNWVSYKAPIGYHSDFLYLKYTSMFSVFFSKQAKKNKQIVEFFKNAYFKNEHIEKYEWLKLQFIDSLDDSLKYLKTKDVLASRDKRAINNTEFILLSLQNL